MGGILTKRARHDKVFPFFVSPADLCLRTYLGWKKLMFCATFSPREAKITGKPRDENRTSHEEERKTLQNILLPDNERGCRPLVFAPEPGTSDPAAISDDLKAIL